MTSYLFELDERTKRLNQKFPLEERVKFLEKPAEAIIYRSGYFHGWGGRTTDEVYYVDSKNRELRHNQVDISWEGRPTSDKSSDKSVRRHPLLNVSGFTHGMAAFYTVALSPLSPLVIKDTIEQGRIAPWIIYGLGLATVYAVGNLLETGPGAIKAWRNYQEYLKNVGA